MSQVLSAAVIGLGSMGANHVRVLSDLAGVELVGAVDTDEGRVARATRGRTIAGYREVEDLLARERLDIASVVVPTGLHEEVALKVISAGVSVLVEKPIAATSAGGRRIDAAARANGVKLAVGHIERFNPAIKELKARLNDGQGGRILQVHARRVGPLPSRIRDVGVIHDLAPHDIDVMRYLLGSEVEGVYAESQYRINTEHEDTLLGLLHFETGVVGVLDINWLTPRKERTIRVLCEGGMFIADYTSQTLEFHASFAAEPREGVIASVTEGPMTRYPIASREPLRAELESFRDAVASGGEVAVTAADGLAAISIAEALATSGSTRATTTVVPAQDRS